VVDTELLETICEYGQHAQHLVGGKRFRLSSETLAKYAGTYEFGPGTSGRRCHWVYPAHRNGFGPCLG